MIRKAVFEEELSKPDCNLIELYEYCIETFNSVSFISYLVETNSVDNIKKIICYHSCPVGKYSSYTYKQSFYGNLVSDCIYTWNLDLLVEILPYIEDKDINIGIVNACVREFNKKGFEDRLRKLFVVCPLFQKKVMSSGKIQF